MAIDKRKIPLRVRRALKEFSQGVKEILGDDLVKILLYGSYARGEQDIGGEPSDVDIMVLVKVHENKIKKVQMEVLDYSYEVGLKYDLLLSPKICSIKTYNNRLSFAMFYKNVQKDGVLIE